MPAPRRGIDSIQQAQVVTVVDTTGAGDAFVGCLAAELGRGGSLAQGLALGSSAAGRAVQAPGALASYSLLRQDTDDVPQV